MRQIARRAVCLLAFLVCMPTVAKAADTAQTSPTLPRYKLEVGKKYSYTDEAHFKYDNSGYDNEGTWDATVVAKNTDGTFRVLLRYLDVRTQKPTEGSERKSESTYYGCADVDDLGRFTELWNSFGVRVEPTKVFLRLPATAEEVASGWQSPKGIFDGKLNYRALEAADAAHPVYEVVEERPESAIYGFEFKDTATFDADGGIFQQRDYTWKQTYGFNGEGTGSLKLTDVQQIEPETCRALTADAERYFRAKRQFDEAIDKKDATPESLDAAAGSLADIKNTLTTPEFQQLLDKQVEEFGGERKYLEEELNSRQALIGQAAEAFTTTDLDNNPQALADYRGKVVLLDFWYRGCGWCIRAMPQIEQVSEHYRGQPVAVLGMNTDGNVDDAKFVVDKLGLAYPNLKAEGLPEKFKVSGFPTMILIDQQGTIRDVQSGWTPTLRADFIAEIDQLLATPK
jgi:thiol-disulfide isomerase/thioredoxin